jgi:endonuclease/exonuclease/phosphatase family metal-dependent hydrolase
MKITVMSFNLRYDKPDPGSCQWQNRVGAIASLIKHYQPDLLGTQEGKPHQLQDLQTYLPEYKIIGGDRLGTGQAEHCAIFYLPQHLHLQQTQDFFLSDTPTIAGSISSSWGNRLPRMATWGNFQVNNPAVFITILNTHLDHEAPQARNLGAALITKYLGTFSPDKYLLVTGDFNANPSTPERQIFQLPLANGQQLQDTVATLPLEQQNTFHEFTGQAWNSIDTVYCDRQFHLEKIIIDCQKWLGVWPSDHFPVIVRLVIDE